MLTKYLEYKYILFIDSAYFLKNGINNDAKEISFAVEEALQYHSCFIIFDLDSIAGVQKKSATKNDRDFAYEIKNPLIF